MCIQQTLWGDFLLKCTAHTCSDLSKVKQSLKSWQKCGLWTTRRRNKIISNCPNPFWALYSSAQNVSLNLNNVCLHWSIQCSSAMTFVSEFLAPIVWTTMTIGQEVLIVTTQSPWSVLPTTIGLRRRTWGKSGCREAVDKEHFIKGQYCSWRWWCFQMVKLSFNQGVKCC